MSTFDDCFAALIGNEGSYSFNSADPGGATKWGVSERVARANGYQGDMRELPLETAKQIAKKLYWDPLHCDQYEARIAFALLDANYNGGHVVLWAQQSCDVKADGKLGPATIQAIQQAEPLAFLLKFNAYRLLYLTACKPWPTFSRGWARRIANNMLKGAQ